MSTAVGAWSRSSWSTRPIRRRRCGPRRSWVCGSPGSTCSRATMARSSWRSTPPRPPGHRVRDQPRRRRGDHRPHRQPDRLPRDRRAPTSDGVDRLGVAELVVHPGADLVGKSLGESGLRDRDISVLTLHRGTTVMPNPHSNRKLEDGDRLLCFGRLEEMRDLIPQRKRRSRVRKLPRSRSTRGERTLVGCRSHLRSFGMPRPASSQPPPGWRSGTWRPLSSSRRPLR